MGGASRLLTTGRKRTTTIQWQNIFVIHMHLNIHNLFVSQLIKEWLWTLVRVKDTTVSRLLEKHQKPRQLKFSNPARCIKISCKSNSSPACFLFCKRRKLDNTVSQSPSSSWRLCFLFPAHGSRIVMDSNPTWQVILTFWSPEFFLSVQRMW